MRVLGKPINLSILPAALAGAALLLAGCASPGSDMDIPASGAQSDVQSGGDSVDSGQSTAAEQSAAVTRLALTYDGGILVVDADTMTVVDDIALPGFNRVADAGDGRHAVVSTAGKFQLLDLGTWAQGHGDHFHFFTDTPQLLDVYYAAEVPGHVVAHGGHTVFFDDGTGAVQIVETDQVAEAGATVESFQSEDAHHGVAVVLEDGTLLVSDGDSESRAGLLAFDADREKIAETQECEGLHGEAVAGSGIPVFGCADGVVIYHGGAIEKILSPDADRAISSLFGSEESPVVLGNYAAAGDELPTQITLIDTESEKITAVDLGASYSFRSLARGDNGEAIVLATDGTLRVLDPGSGAQIGSYPVIEAWEAPEDWQAPRPAVFAADGNAYVNDPSTQTLYVVDIETGEVWSQIALPRVTNEIMGVTGYATSVSDGAADVHDHDHDHDDEADK